MRPVEAFFRSRRAGRWGFCDALISEKNIMHQRVVVSPKPTSVSPWPSIIGCTGKEALRYAVGFQVDYSEHVVMYVFKSKGVRRYAAGVSTYVLDHTCTKNKHLTSKI